MKVKLNEIKPNVGNDRAYLKELRTMLRRIKEDINDAKTDDVTQFGNRIDYLLEQWSKRLDRLGYTISKRFINRNRATFDKRFMQELKKAGFTVNFQLSPQIEDILEASVKENVGLIKSIGVDYLERVQQQVWSGVASGYDLGQIAKDLSKAYGISDRRAKNIARDQGAKAHAVIERERRKEAGITQAVWLHSHAGKVPRPSHVKANGKVFDIEKGLYLDGAWVLPGQAINCLPGQSVVTNVKPVKKLWRRRYSGELTELITKSGKSISATPNHPVLTQRGWIAIKDINVGDYVVNRLQKGINTIEANVQSSKTTFSEIFDATSFLVGGSKMTGAAFQFHGDISNSEVDVIDTAGFLPNDINTSLVKSIFDIFFTKANHLFVGRHFDSESPLFPTLNALFTAPESIIRFSCSVLSLLKGHSAHANDICLRLTSYFNSAVLESIPNASTRDIETLRQLKLTQSGFIQGDDFIVREFFQILNLSLNLDAPSDKMLSESSIMNSNGIRCLNNTQSGFSYELDCVVNKSSASFVDHVYNLENDVGWYLSENIVTHNCRCGSMSVIDI